MKNEKITEEEIGYLFNDGKFIVFETIMFNKIDFRRETGSLKVRITSNEINVDFIEEIKPTKDQLDTIKKLKLSNKKIFFEIVDKNNKPMGCRGFDVTISEMEQQLSYFYKKIQEIENEI